jgi:hypothetical protein
MAQAWAPEKGVGPLLTLLERGLYGSLMFRGVGCGEEAWVSLQQVCQCTFVARRRSHAKERRHLVPARRTKAVLVKQPQELASSSIHRRVRALTLLHKNHITDSAQIWRLKKGFYQGARATQIEIPSIVD